MWKIVTRSIRETFERRACRTNVYSQPSQDNAKNEVKTNLTGQQKFLAPNILTCDKGFCEFSQTAGAKGKEHNDKWNTKHSWPEAIGLSSVLAASWVVCQSLCFNKRIFNNDDSKEKKLLNYTRVSSVLRQLRNLQLNSAIQHILPVTNCVGNDKKSSNTDSQWNPGKPFGPITLEEAFKEATDEFAETHKNIVGEYELCYGIKALKEERYKDAWTHFSRGAKLSSPGSMFNLGLCYELGIGTLMDLTKAVKYYNEAAKHDHADALYNLGVYHAQGKGGLRLSIDIARTYFIKAAELGQKQAQCALDLEKTKIKAKENISAVPKTCLKKANLETNEMEKMHNKLVDTMTSFITKSMHESSNYDKEIIEDATQTFLKLLGIKEPSPTPIIINTNDYRVPC